MMFLFNIHRIIFNYYKTLVQLSKHRNNSESNRLSKDPHNWEFSVFSQNGEDGIIETLLSNLKNSNKYFVEIGASNAIENNTSFLAIVKKFNGLMVDGDRKSIYLAKKIINRFCIAVDCVEMFVDKNSIENLIEKMVYLNPDVFSLDIDGNDFYLAKNIIENGIRPKIFIVEYNSSYGPDSTKTIVYDPKFNMFKANPSFLYYGVSIAGWRKYFDSINYHFVTVDSNGINAFFIDKNEFENDFYESINTVPFKENFYQKYKFKKNWDKQFELIAEHNFYEI
jgi:hypothetical protein